MNTVRQILKTKGNSVVTTHREASVYEALALLVEKRIGSLVVVENDQVVGIFTERDFAHRVGFQGLDPKQIKVEEVMTRDLVTVSSDQSVNVCMALMTEHRIRHLPVFHKGKLVGIISIGDVVKDLIEELRFMIVQMEKYIQGLR